MTVNNIVTSRQDQHIMPIETKPILLTVREDVYKALDSERDYQDSKAAELGEPPHTHSIEEMMYYAEDYLRELKTVLSRKWVPSGTIQVEALHILRKVTALGVAAMEYNGCVQRPGFERK